MAYKYIIRSLILILITFSAQFSKANDSDIVNCNRAWKIVALGSSTTYGYGASVYDSSWVGRFTTYLKSKNPSNELINLGIPGYKTYQNLRPDGYTPPADRPTPVSGYNITAALSLHPDAIIINMPSNDALNNYSIAEQQANFEAALYLADSANVPVWVTTTQPRLYMSESQVQNLKDMRNWIISRFGNKSVNFWESVANEDGSINDTYLYDYAHVNNLGHALFFQRMKAECILDSLCNRLIPPCNFYVESTIVGNTNVCGNMGVGDSATYFIEAEDAASFNWSVSNAATMGLSAVRNGSAVKVKFGTTFTTGTLSVSVVGCNGAIVNKSISLSKTIPGAPSAILGLYGTAATTYICPFIGGSNITYVAAPPTTNASAVIAYRWVFPVGATLVNVLTPDSSIITLHFATVPTTTTLSVTSISGCGKSVAKSIILNKTAPAAPVAINGSTDICSALGNASQSAAILYNISAVNNAASYFWTVPSGATLVSGQGTTSISVVFPSTFVSGNITVKSLSPCGNSIAKSLTIYKRTAIAPAAIQKEFSPLSIAAATNVCGAISETYRIKKVAYATAYNWQFQSGLKATITHLNAPGINDTVVVVNFLSGFTKDTLTVVATSGCNASTAKTIVLNATLLPPTPTNIISESGNYTPCIGNQVTYNVVCPTATTTQAPPFQFRWTKPNNSVIVSANQDSSVVNIQFNAGYVGGSITAKGITACGFIGTAKSISLQYLPPTPTAITANTGNYNACVGNTIVYSVTSPTPSATQATPAVFRWIKPNKTRIATANSDSSIVSLYFEDGYIGGTLSAKGQSICGVLGTAKTQALTSNGCTSFFKKSATENQSASQESSSVFPNPNQGVFNIAINPQFTFPVKVQIIDVNRKAALQYQMFNSLQGTSIKMGSNKPGIYFLKISNAQFSETIKMNVQ